MSYNTELLCFSYACSAQSDELTERVKYSNKILLPESVLFSINQTNGLNNNGPMFFKISNKETNYGQICGVQEFSAPPGVVHVPYHIMNESGIGEGSNVKIELVIPVDGTYMKLRLHNTEFANLSDPKAVLERILSRDYPVLSEGQTIALHYKELNKVYRIDVVKTEPASIIKTIDVNINVDFDKPLDYVEPPKTCWEEETKIAHSTVRDVSSNIAKYKKLEYDIDKFPGNGHRLGSD